ncbi:contactin-associated protein-like 4 isoform X3 [Salmo trutta]|uniref:Contactin-associated protein-like 4 n=1 Tax=Salmo trutta TaxID=8032 RepID=A0A673ZF21_SALTR|nr:contactin-associated protein-like 4 isoform X3 [Salmo trutta]
MDLETRRHTGMLLQLAVLFCCSYGAIGKDSCDGPLVSSLPQSSFRSSSQLSNSHGPGFAKVNRRDGAGGWAPVESNKYQWLEVDLGVRTEITAVATQGRYGSSDWVSSFLLMFSDTGRNWKQYRQEDSIGAFTGNSNADSVVQFKLQQPVFARFLRLLPLDWNPNGRIGLRLEAYGCPYSKSASSGPESHMVVSLGSLLDDLHWHHVAIERVSGRVNFTVDKSTQQIQVPAELSPFEINEISFGGVQCHGTQMVLSRRNFHGCLENLLWNEVNVNDLAKQHQKVSITGNVTFTCAEPVSVPVTFAGAQSFLQLPGAALQQRDAGGGGVALVAVGVAISLQFRTWNRAGLLLTFDLQQQVGSLWLYLSETRVRLQIHKAGRILLDAVTGFGLNDGQWHSVDLTARRGRLTITVDKEESSTAHASPSFPVVSGNNLFFGGCPDSKNNQECRNPFNVFQGCMRHIHVDNNAVDLIKVQQMLIGNYSDLQIDMCGIIDRCSPSHCEHGGRCTQSWSTFHCNCSNTGYSGATCHSSVYEQSCEVYKHKGNTTGLYYIDVDGSGLIKPQLIYCNMTDKTWMVIQHNNTELTKLKASSGINQHLAYFNYSADAEQLGAIITQAEHCEQEVVYHCRKSRLLNTPDGSPFTWWVGRTDEPQTYWGGAVPGSQQCGCGLQGNCIDSDHYCNCDADRKEWAADSGLLIHKENLPVRWVVVGDIQRPESEAAYRVSPLRCHGDKNFWNAAFFNKETSYLHFPTFHGELSADISFLFKTTASSGVFLENLGIKDFIRVELSSPMEVVFSFDVGNGPFEVRVETGGMALNDNRWHRVRAERNVKEASLCVDAFPGATQKAPADGHIHLQLNSQLFVGGTASRMKGFLGCIRSLQLNGRTLDLEERAKITPGVSPGCPGHCSSYGHLCQNQARCVERYNGFSCDCGLSAYAGPFCQREVSAYFKPGTSVQYTFKEPYELTRNTSTQSQSSSIYSDLTLRGENVSFSFRTTQSPALLLYICSYYREYLAVLLNRNGYLDVKYKLQNSRDAEVFRTSIRNLANGQLHRVSIRRISETVSVQIDQHRREDFNLTSDTEFNAIKSVVLGKVQESGELDPEIARLNSLGFSGCLSVVQFNSITPLKAALLYPNTNPVIVTGPLAESTCGSSSPANPYPAETTHPLSDHSGTLGTGEPIVNAIKSDSALIGGVIAVVIFVILSALAIMVRFLYRRKETFHSQEPKSIKPEADSPEYPFHSEPTSQNVLSENQKEYFI